MLHAAKQYGYTVGETSFDWGRLKEMRDAYVRRLNGIYHRNVEKSGVTLVYGVSFEAGPACVCWCVFMCRSDESPIAEVGPMQGGVEMKFARHA